MPKAQVVLDAVHVDLKTCPGGYVKLRRLTYGESLKRKSMMTVAIEKSSGKDAQAMVHMANREISYFEFGTCILDHNLEKEDGSLFNFKNSVEIDLLDPRIAEEIELEMNKLNNFEDDAETLGN